MEEQLNESLQKLIEKLTNWVDLIITNMPNIILALVMFGLAYLLSQKLHHWTYKVLRIRIKQQSIRSLIANFVSITIISIRNLLGIKYS